MQPERPQPPGMAAKEPQRPRGIAVAWYRREDWDTLLALFTDGDQLPRSYDDWLVLAEKAYADLEAEGALPIRALVEPVHFRAWCHANRMQPDTRARSRYAAEIARRTRPRRR